MHREPRFWLQYSFQQSLHLPTCLYPASSSSFDNQGDVSNQKSGQLLSVFVTLQSLPLQAGKIRLLVMVRSAFVPSCFSTCQASLSFTVSQSLLKLMSIESMMPSNRLILCCPLIHLPSVSPSIRVFFNESALRIKWPKYWSFSFSPSNEHSGLISFRRDWFDLLTAQGTLKSLL